MTTSSKYEVSIVVGTYGYDEMRLILGMYSTEQVDDLKLRLYGDTRVQHDLYSSDETLDALEEWHRAQTSEELPTDTLDRTRSALRFELRILVKD